MEREILINERIPYEETTRGLLINAFAVGRYESDALREYKKIVEMYETEQCKLNKLQHKISKLSKSKCFFKGNRIKKVTERAQKSADLVSKYDRQLIELEHTETIVTILMREKAAKINQQKQSYKKSKVITKNDKIKKRVTLITLIISIIAFILLIVLVADIGKKIAYNKQERNIAIGEMSEDFTNVYADVLSFEVEYTITASKFKNDIQIGSSRTESVICKCITVEGVEFWLRLPTYAYSGTIEYRGENPTSDYDNQYFSEPIRIRGYMTTFDNIADDVPSYYKDTLILSCDGSYSSIQ